MLYKECGLVLAVVATLGDFLTEVTKDGPDTVVVIVIQVVGTGKWEKNSGQPTNSFDQCQIVFLILLVVIDFRF